MRWFCAGVQRPDAMLTQFGIQNFKDLFKPLSECIYSHCSCSRTIFRSDLSYPYDVNFRLLSSAHFCLRSRLQMWLWLHIIIPWSYTYRSPETEIILTKVSSLWSAYGTLSAFPDCFCVSRSPKRLDLGVSLFRKCSQRPTHRLR